MDPNYSWQDEVNQWAREYAAGAGIFNFTTDSYRERERRPEDNITTREPRKGYIDAGIVLTKGIILTREQMDSCPTDEWKEFSDFVDGMVNIYADEIYENKVMHIYSVVPTITNMEA